MYYLSKTCQDIVQYRLKQTKTTQPKPKVSHKKVSRIWVHFFFWHKHTPARETPKERGQLRCIYVINESRGSRKSKRRNESRQSKEEKKSNMMPKCAAQVQTPSSGSGPLRKPCCFVLELHIWLTQLFCCRLLWQLCSTNREALFMDCGQDTASGSRGRRLAMCTPNKRTQSEIKILTKHARVTQASLCHRQSSCLSEFLMCDTAVGFNHARMCFSLVWAQVGPRLAARAGAEQMEVKADLVNKIKVQFSTVSFPQKIRLWSECVEFHIGARPKLLKYSG